MVSIPMSLHKSDALSAPTRRCATAFMLADRADGMAHAWGSGDAVRPDLASHLAGVDSGVRPHYCRLGGCELPYFLGPGERCRLPMALLRTDAAREYRRRCDPGHCPELRTGGGRRGDSLAADQRRVVQY